MRNPTRSLQRSPGKLSHTVAIGFSVLLLAIAVGCDKTKSTPAFPTTGGPHVTPNVRGSLILGTGRTTELAAAVTSTSKNPVIFLPGITVALIDSATGKTVDRLITDLSGRFTFWGVRPGVYRICWTKAGFVTGCFSRYVPVTTLPVTLGWISVSVEPKSQSTAVYGSVNMRGGNTAQSYLIHKINGTQVAAGGSGAKMPLGGALSAAELQIIIKWVQDGAPP